MEHGKGCKLHMDNKNENEMEQIQRGLEDFLEKELGQRGTAESAGRGSRTGTQSGQVSGGFGTDNRTAAG